MWREFAKCSRCCDMCGAFKDLQEGVKKQTSKSEQAVLRQTKLLRYRFYWMSGCTGDRWFDSRTESRRPRTDQKPQNTGTDQKLPKGGGEGGSNCICFEMHAPHEKTLRHQRPASARRPQTGTSGVVA